MDSSIASIAIPLVVAIVAALLAFGAIALLLRRQQPEVLEEAAGLKLLRSYKWSELAHLLLQSLRRRGYEHAESDRVPGDAGSDLVVQRGSDRYLVQCKQGAHLVGAADVRNVLALMPTLDATGAILVTTGRFGADAQQAAKGRPVQLLDGFSFWREAKAILPGETLDHIEREVAARQRLFTMMKGVGAALAAAVTYVAVTVWMRPPAEAVAARAPVSASTTVSNVPKAASTPASTRASASPSSASTPPSTSSVSAPLATPASTPSPPAPTPAAPPAPAPAPTAAPTPATSASTAAPASTPAASTPAAAPPSAPPSAPVASAPTAAPAPTPATAAPSSAASTPAPAAVKKPAVLPELTEAQEQERRQAALISVRAVVGVESSDWSTKSTLAVALRAGNEERLKSLVAAVCTAVVEFEELRYTRLQVTDSLATSEADKRVHWRQCQ